MQAQLWQVHLEPPPHPVAGASAACGAGVRRFRGAARGRATAAWQPPSVLLGGAACVAAAATAPRARRWGRGSQAISAAVRSSLGTQEVQAGTKVQVSAKGVQFFHVPKNAGKAFDPHGLAGEVVSVIEDENLTPNRPVLVKLTLPSQDPASSAKRKSFKAYFETEELCVCCDPGDRVDGTEPQTVKEEDSRWKINLLYDGDCPPCMKQVELLRKRMDENPEYAGVVRLTDLTAPDYDAELCGGVEFEDGMRHIHAVTRDGQVVSGVDVFRRVYSVVGMEWVHTVTSLPLVGGLLDWLYDVWAEYRLELTGRAGAVEQIEARRRRIQELSAAECEAECEIDWNAA